MDRALVLPNINNSSNAPVVRLGLLLPYEFAREVFHHERFHFIRRECVVFHGVVPVAGFQSHPHLSLALQVR